uniref:Uncharacterized protein n=1 Tax=Candidatus Kentrum sp. DK TaxID=2126562 RepID=A0A450RWA3_9GAMM|nr:MAG: hypothetical protein BECKDK2373C_GA0170839_100534 [Candidatus Kentron sp. DK]
MFRLDLFVFWLDLFIQSVRLFMFSFYLFMFWLDLFIRHSAHLLPFSRLSRKTVKIYPTTALIYGFSSIAELARNQDSRYHDGKMENYPRR